MHQHDAVNLALGIDPKVRIVDASPAQGGAAELAYEAGVSKRTLERIEAGRGCELVKLIRVLRILKLNDGFNALIPELPPSPMAQLKLQGKQRRRVARPRAKKRTSSPSTSSSPSGPTPKPWTWGK